MKNIGPKSWEMLAKIGVETDDDIRSAGPVALMARLKAIGINPSLNLLDALAMGLEDRHFTDITAEEKQRLRRELEDLAEIEKDFLGSIE